MAEPTAPEPLIDPDCRDGKHGSCVGGHCECMCHGRLPAPERIPPDDTTEGTRHWCPNCDPHAFVDESATVTGGRRLGARLAQAEAERDHAEGELSARRAHETRWELEHAEVERLRAELTEARDKHQAEIASLQRLADRFREQDDRRYARIVAERNVLTAAIERVRVLHSPRDRGAGPECMGCRTTATFTRYEACRTLATLDAPETTPDAPTEDA